MTNTRRVFFALMLASAAALPVSVTTVYSANAATAEDLNKDAEQALNLLYRTNPVAQQISKKARAVLVFPKVIKAGLVFGGSYGEGVLKQGPKVVNYYNSVSGSWGLQAGAQSYGYVVLLMNKKAEDYINQSPRLGDRRRPDGGHRERRSRQEPVDIDTERRRLCLHLRPGRTNGRSKHRGNEDYSRSSAERKRSAPSSFEGRLRLREVAAVERLRMARSDSFLHRIIEHDLESDGRLAPSAHRRF